MLYNTGCSRVSHQTHLMGSTNGIVIYSMQLVVAWGLASAVMLEASGAPPPSTTSLAHCPKTCGSVSIWYPFGIGPGCFREGFELTCSNNTKPWKLFLGNTTTQVTSLFPSGTVLASVMYTIPMTPGVGTYNLSWDSPGRNLNIETYNYLAFLGCGIGVYLFHPDTGDLLGHCTSKCASMSAMLMATEGGICNGMGCCTVTFPVLFRGFRVTIVKNNETAPQPFANLTIKAFLTFYPYIFSVADLLSDKINASTVGASSAYLSTVITDEPNCASARLDNKTRYACGSSNCVDVANGGYSCTCSGNSDNGSPYLLDDCKQEYNPTPKMNCSRSCGTTSIPFPFGLEPGCFAKRRFQLNCVSNRTLIGRPPAKYEVTNISLVEGLLYVNKLSEFEDANTKFLSVYYGGGSGYFGQQLIYGLEKSVSSEEYGVWGWSVTNLTCENAKRKSEYACLSTNSECLGVTRGGLYIGYRCKCSVGFEGNPYVQNGCTDIDECRIPNYCNGTCYNFKGSYSCCPHGMSFDPVRRQCASNKRQNLLLGVAIGISSGFGVLALTLSAIVLVKRWKRGAQKKIRRAYFRKNNGLLLEQLISSSESVTHNTRIFSLEELEKATNNFDSTRILGHGGHGTVYKGILSDQRVVAIKKSKIVEQSEIDQFVNEVAILSQIIHRNVVKLFGCCLESEVPLLVYEFISNGTLHDLLHGDLSAKCLLTWDDRIRIALEGAGALAYLHSSAAMPIFHRDVKSTNILMDGTFATKVSDFGASRSISIDQTRVVTAVQGTFGYLDPEYYYTGQLTEKSDVYSFGVILVELLTRKKPIFLNCLGEMQNLCHCFLRGLQDNTVMDIVDAQVVEEASQTEIDEIASVAEMCLRTKGEKRPKMKEVELRLQLLRARRSRTYKEELQRDSETKPLLTPKSKSTSLTVTKNVEFGLVANPASQAVSRCYTMEREIASSAEFPR